MQFSHMWSSGLTIELGNADSTKLFTDARRQNAVNNGVLMFVDLTECLVRESTIASSHGVREYNLMSSVNIPGLDYLKPAKQQPEFQFTDTNGNVQYVTGDDFPRRDINWLNQYQPGWRQSTGGTPGSWYLRPDGGRVLFGFDTPPEIDSTAGESAKVLFPYVQRPAVMTSSTDIPFTVNSTVRSDLEPYHQAAVHYGAYELEKLRLNDAGAQTQYQLFLGYVQRYLQTMRVRGGQQIRAARNYFREARSKRWTASDAPISDPWS